QVTRLVMCSGKVYYDLLASPARAAPAHIAIGRLELLYPFPAAEIADHVARYPNLKEIVWVQEEPRNTGARKFLLPKSRALAPPSVTIGDVSRPERASLAEGYPAAHVAEQTRI